MGRRNARRNEESAIEGVSSALLAGLVNERQSSRIVISNFFRTGAVAEMEDKENTIRPLVKLSGARFEVSDGDKRGRLFARSASTFSKGRLLSFKFERVIEDNNVETDVRFAAHWSFTSGVECGEGSAPLISLTRLSSASSSTGVFLSPWRTPSGR